MTAATKLVSIEAGGGRSMAIARLPIDEGTYDKSQTVIHIGPTAYY